VLINATELERLRAELAEAQRDAEIGKLVRRKLVSCNDIPVERCTIRREEVAAIDAARKETL
jgi:hypothetical protein